MNNFAIQYLQKKYKYQIPETTMYEKIDTWNLWYKNDETLHEYVDSYGKKRQSYSLGMAKRLCEDWASIIFTEKDEISTDESKNNEFVENFVQKIHLTDELPEMIENSAWSGTCGVIIRLKNVKLIKLDGVSVLQANEKTDYDLIKVNAKNIIPLRVEHGKIIDVAFVSDLVKDNKKVIYLEIHRKTDKGYVISNVYLDSKSGKEVNFDGVIKDMVTMSDTPLFSLLTPPTVNNIDNNLGLGLSVYGNAIDQLDACDVAYNNFVMDFVLGGKKIIYNKKLIKYGTRKVKNSDGTYTTEEYPIYPDDISKQQFMQVGDGLSKDELIHEYNPDLRPEQNKTGIQFALDMLSFKGGLGTKYYEFNGGNVVTATQYMGDRQDLMKNAKKYRENLDNFISGIIKAGLLLERTVFHKDVTEDCNVLVANRDGLLVSDEEIKEQYRQEYNMGLISKATYLKKLNNWSDEEVEEELQKLANENRIKSVSVDE